MNKGHASDSAEQRSAEAFALQAVGKKLGVELILRPLQLGGNVYFVVINRMCVWITSGRTAAANASEAVEREALLGRDSFINPVRRFYHTGRSISDLARARPLMCEGAYGDLHRLYLRQSVDPGSRARVHGRVCGVRGVFARHC